MAGFVINGNNKYIGTVKLGSGEQDLHNGTFLQVSWTAGTAATPNVNTQVAYFVENVIDTVDEQQIDDADFVVSAGSYVRIKKMIPGEMFVTDKATTDVAVGAEVDVGTTGTITATSGSPVQTFQVVEKPTLWGATAYKCVTLD